VVVKDRWKWEVLHRVLVNLASMLGVTWRGWTKRGGRE
jgi:hypothetical protein